MFESIYSRALQVFAQECTVASLLLCSTESLRTIQHAINGTLSSYRSWHGDVLTFFFSVRPSKIYDGVFSILKTFVQLKTIKKTHASKREAGCLGRNSLLHRPNLWPGFRGSNPDASIARILITIKASPGFLTWTFRNCEGH